MKEDSNGNSNFSSSYVFLQGGILNLRIYVSSGKTTSHICIKPKSAVQTIKTH